MMTSTHPNQTPIKRIRAGIRKILWLSCFCAASLLFFPGRAAAQADRRESGTITSEQADTIISELKQIRQLLEKQQIQLARLIASQPADAPPQKVQMNVSNGWYSIGRTDAPVTLVEFADYQCPYCKRFHTSAYRELKKNYIDAGKVRFVSRDLPLEFHPLAWKAAEAVRCAGDQGKYWELRDALYANSAPPSDDVIKKASESLSLDFTAFQTCLSTEKHKSDVQRDAADAAALRLNGTPSFVLGKTANDRIDGVVLAGALPFASFDAAIQQLLKAASPAPNGPPSQESSGKGKIRGLVQEADFALAESLGFH
jgi:protein-disulfide isomerase